MKADCADEGTAMNRLPSVDQRLSDAINRAVAYSESVKTLTAKDGDLRLSAPNALLPKAEISVSIVVSFKPA